MTSSSPPLVHSLAIFSLSRAERSREHKRAIVGSATWAECPGTSAISDAQWRGAQIVCTAQKFS
jgi:hypothetical protein